ncbi:MAG: GIY-YIG nuclease family protein [Candidatus Marinimicrobia bacterium]|nr:GIY-YIG nuclease family protein [Candidatus Neomarinimicrobiota bacterium]
MSYTVYILLSDEGYNYVGMTSNLTRRLQEHRAGHSHYTRRGKGWKVVYQEDALSGEKARKREKYLKSHAGKEWLIRRNK